MWKCYSLSHVQLFVTPWTIAHQASLSMEFSRQEYWSGLSFSSPEDHPDPGIKPGSLALQVDSLPPEPLLKHHQLINNIVLKGFLPYVFFFPNFIFIFKLYIIVLVLPNIKMNLPQIYMCSPS